MKEQHVLVAELVPFLLSRGYGPNERAPSERELAERFQAGRPQIREALSVLEALRLIERRPKSGIYMTPESASIEALRLFAEVGIPLTRDELSQTVEVRRIQELEAIRLACRRHRAENIAALQACLGDWEEAITGEGPVAELDRAFHCGLVKATQNTVLLRLVDIFYLMTARRAEYFFRSPDRRKQSYVQHQQIFEAVLRRDEERAVELLDAHLESANTYWQDLLGS
ncbi:FadR/GntR family transcriptional regulator [Pseudonocardia nigra]|uniref:FadR/GntR family transcriptional regulator n=1 Tax=Pseudonocardia nigra TaxID=1921578 RepID=UPI001C5DCF35|nr:FadR/GntR family transcriptional regulator [Pseudonocardia nigra]